MGVQHPAFGGTVSAFAYNPLLMAGKDPVLAKFRIATGLALKAGSVLGASNGATGTVTQEADGGNTGQGTMTLGTPATSGKAKVGAYKVTCIATASGGGTFRVEDPDGFVLGDVAVGTEFSDDIVFTIADGDPDFAVGDFFIVTVPAAATAGDLVLSAAAAVDGSEIPMAILPEDLDTTGGAKVVDVFVEGKFNETALVFGAGHDPNSVRLPLRERGVYLDTPRHSYL